MHSDQKRSIATLINRAQNQKQIWRSRLSDQRPKLSVKSDKVTHQCWEKRSLQCYRNFLENCCFLEFHATQFMCMLVVEEAH